MTQRGQRMWDRLSDPDRWRQAAIEFRNTFLVTFLPLAIAFWNGLHTGDRIVVPDYGTVRAFLTSAGVASFLAAAKSVTWVFTGTKVIPPGGRVTAADRDGKTAVQLDDHGHRDG